MTVEEMKKRGIDYWTLWRRDHNTSDIDRNERWLCLAEPCERLERIEAKLAEREVERDG